MLISLKVFQYNVLSQMKKLCLVIGKILMHGPMMGEPSRKMTILKM